MLGGPAMLVSIGIVAVLIGLCGLLVYLSERHATAQARTMPSVIGWVVLTLIKDAPWDPVTKVGKTAYYAIEFLKPVSIGLIIAALTSRLVQFLLRAGTGRGRVRLKDHIVVCGWSGKGNEILSELRGRGDEESGRAVVILAELTDNPSKDELTTFIHGDPTKADDLVRAGIMHARTAIVLADNSYPGIDVEDMDSRTLLAVLAIESIAPEVYTCVEVIRSENRDHFKRTKADEVVISSKLTGALLAHSAATPGLSKVVDELLTFPAGNEFYWVGVPQRYAGLSFRELLVRLKDETNSLPIAIAKDGATYVTNPPADEVVSVGDRLLVICPTYPQLEG